MPTGVYARAPETRARIAASMTRHGHARTGKHSSTYTAWKNMRARCNNPSNQDYRHYGGRGITICERWESFENFLADMGEKPADDLTLDRIDNDGNYTPENCRWVTWTAQRHNRRTV